MVHALLTFMFYSTVVYACVALALALLLKAGKAADFQGFNMRRRGELKKEREKAAWNFLRLACYLTVYAYSLRGFV